MPDGRGAPCSRRKATISGFASKTFCPAKLLDLGQEAAAPRRPGSRCRARSGRRSGSRPSRGRGPCARRRCRCRGSRSRRARRASRGRSRDGGSARPRARCPWPRRAGSPRAHGLPSRASALAASRSALASSSTSSVPSTRVEARSRASGWKREREVGGQRPGRRGPDDGEDALARERRVRRGEAVALRPRPAGSARRSGGLTWFSSYSTSASASAVRHEMHQCTDFLAL